MTLRALRPAILALQNLFTSQRGLTGTPLSTHAGTSASLSAFMRRWTAQLSIVYGSALPVVCSIGLFMSDDQ